MIESTRTSAAMGCYALALISLLTGCAAVASVDPGGHSDTALTRDDQNLAQISFQKALETSVSGQTVSWTNQASGVTGFITPTRTWKTENGVYCRSYRERIRLKTGQSQTSRGTACRDKAGNWKIA